MDEDATTPPASETTSGLGDVPVDAPQMVAAPPPVVPLHTSAAPVRPSAPSAAPVQAAAPQSLPEPPSSAQSPIAPAPTSPPTQAPIMVTPPLRAPVTQQIPPQAPTPLGPPTVGPVPLVAAPPSPSVAAAPPAPSAVAYAPVAAVPPTAATNSGRGLSRVLFGVFAGVLALGLLATGFALARATDDEPTPAAQAPIVAASNDDNSSVQAPIESGAEPVADVAQAILPSVVNILAGQGQGSGIGYTDTHIVTNAHVVADETTVQVQFADGSSVEGRVIGRDRDRDLAVVEVEPTDSLIPATFAASETVEVGQLAIALGSPFGLDQTVTSGVISAIDRVVPAGDTGQNLVAMLQTDAPINPGNSGGALADREGRIIGMNTAIRTETGTFAGVGFAIPADTIRLIADRLIAGESVELGFLGVSMDTAPVGRAGALVVEVVSGSPADVAGVEVGDLVISIEASAVTEPADLAAAIRLRSPGDEVEITLLRDGTEVAAIAELSAG